LNLRLWAMLALMCSLVSLAVGTSFAKSLFPALGAEGTTAYRLFFATLMLMAVFRPWRRKWVWADALPLGLYGVTLGVMNLLFYSAIKTIPFGVAIAIEFTGPLAVAVWTSKKPSDWLWVVLAALAMDTADHCTRPTRHGIGLGGGHVLGALHCFWTACGQALWRHGHPDGHAGRRSGGGPDWGITCGQRIAQSAVVVGWLGGGPAVQRHSVCA
jgi:threonine/homoserine efflux transporter RhtA